MFSYSLAEPLVQMKDVQLTLGGRLILENITATIRDIRRPGMQQGQVVAFLGPSGVGKSQTFWILAGLSQPDKGEVLVGNPPAPVQGGQVGVVTQHYTLFEHRTVLGNLRVAAKQKGIPSDAARKQALELLRKFGLADRAGAWPKELSGGQRQRVAIAQQLLCSDIFLLMDEPFSGLDPVMKTRVCELINEIASMDEMRTLIVVTHDVRAALSIADHVWLIGRDRGPQGEVLSGAKIKEEIDLKERGIAWRENRESLPQYEETVREIEKRFLTL